MTTEYTPNFSLAMPDFRMSPWHDLVNGNMATLDRLLFSAMSNANVEPWANSTLYQSGVSVVDGSDATVWVCVVTHTSAAAPTTFAADRSAHPTYWTQLLAGFAPRGQWQNSTNYFPYDLVYDSSLGIMALCILKHTSRVSGNIKADAAFWTFLVDMSSSTLATAVAVTYSGVGSGIPKTNVQEAIDYTETQIVSLNSASTSLGSRVSAVENVNSTQDVTLTAHGTRLTGVESVNTTQDSTLSNHTTRITALESALSSGTVFPANTKMLFYQATAPTGWTKVTTENDKVLRVVSGTTGGTSGGTNDFSTVNISWSTASYVLTVSQLPKHTHAYNEPGTPVGLQGGSTYPSSYVSTSSKNTGVTGGDTGHSHDLVLNMKYIDIIIASKST